MSRRLKKMLVSSLSLFLVLSMLTTEAFAVIKEVGVGGAYSINDLGQSDNHVDMDSIKADYLPFRRTDWLTEYFHKDSEAAAKADLGEAISWLIDNEIITRDAEVKVSNVHEPGYQGSEVPNITVKKVDITQYLNKMVGRSDLIMYLYKAVFGPVDARTVGVVTPNTRVENGTRKNLHKMMSDHNYWERVVVNEITQVAPKPEGGNGGNGGTGTSGGAGGAGGEGGGSDNVTQSIVTRVDTASQWRYTPQGDEYESMFGDTNIFISEVDISQNVDAGAGGNGGGGGDASGAFSVNNGGGGGGGGAAGVGQNAVQYETDYKQIYYVPGSDILFYRANDCVELYIQYALSRGVLSSDPILKTDAYKEIFTDPVTGANAEKVNKLHIWSPMALPFLVNESNAGAINHDKSTVRSTSDTIYNKARFAQGNPNRQWNVLGSNYNIQWNNSTLTITRNNLFNSDTGYFDSERVSKMQFYKYIYDFIGGAEKKMSSLEVDIINYKYGMQLDALGTAEDVYILKYLIAAGIIDYTSRYDFQNLNESLTYSDFFTILYRVANPNARLDFSKVQLTDSESQWQAQGYSAREVAMVTDQVTSISPVYEDTDAMVEPDPSPFAVIHYDEEGDLEDPEVLRAADILNSVETFEGEDGTSTAFTDRLGDIYDISTSVGEGDIVNMGSVKIHGMTFSFRGAYVSPRAGGSSSPMAVYCRAFDDEGNAVEKDPSSASAKSADNDILNIFGYYMDELQNADGRFYDWWESADGVARVDKSWGVSPYHWLAAAKNWGRDVADYFTGGSSSTRYEDTAYVDCYYYFCSNVYVIALLQQHDDVYDDLIEMLEEAQEPVERGFWAGLWDALTGNAHKEQVFHNMILSLQTTIEEYVEGDLSPQSITFYMDPSTNVLGNPNGASGGSSVSHKDAITMSRGDSFASLCNAVGNLDKIEVRYNVNGEGNNEMWTLQRTSGVIENMLKMFGDTANEKTARDVWEHGDNSTANSYSVRLSIETPTTRAELETAMARGLGRLDYDGATDYNLSLQLQTPSDGSRYGGFVSWASISANSGLLHIEQIGDCILHNTVTDTYAYFPPEGVDYKYALVGSAIVEGDPNEGVAKEMNGQKWYWFDAVKLLAGMQGESSILNGIEGVTLPNKSVTYHAMNIPVVSESGFQGSSLNAIRLRLGEESALKNVSDNVGGTFIRSQQPTDGYYWGNYIAASSSNRVLNMVSRKITYSVNNSNNTKNVAYAMIFLRPTDIGSTATVTASMSLQDTLDAVAQAPSDEAGAAKWNANKQLCNDFLNWLYCTDGQEYLNTGYLTPEVYIYAENRDVAASLSVAQFGDPTEAMVAHGINYRSLKPVTSGMVDDPGIVPNDLSVDTAIAGVKQSMPPLENAEGLADDMYQAAYYLGEDYRVAIVGDRVLVHESYVPGLVGYIGKDAGTSMTRYRYRMANRTIQDTSFYVGRTFYIGNHNKDYILEGLPTPKLTVIEIEDGGLVHCQLGPISGIPCKVNGKWVVINMDQTIERFPDTRYDTDLSTISGNGYANSWQNVKTYMVEQTSAKLTWTDNVVEYPVLNPPVSGRRYAVYNGKKIQVYGEQSTSNPINEWTCNIKTYSPSKTLNSVQDEFYTTLSGKGIPNRLLLNQIETYAEVTFSAYDFVVRNNCLIPTENIGGITTGDLFSPSLFVCINDMIIEQMIYDSKNAIPLNQVPQGALVQVGEGWYIAANGDETNKKFVGYSPLDGFTSKTTSPKAQDASLSMASHFIRGGNQYINIVHYITDFTVLDDTASGETSYWTWKDIAGAIGPLKLSDSTLNGSYRVACLANSSTQVAISTGAKMSAANVATVGYRYAPVLLQFSDLLYAYPVSTGSANPVYKICNFCKNSTGGALDQLPFFASDVINARLNDVTTTVMSGGYVYNNESRFLMDAFREQFQSAFAGDVFTLARMLLFIVLVWLFVMSWVCYGFYFSRLMPLVDAICHPTVDRNSKGVDLFKIFTLGTISVDSDFKLGRFLQYDLIIAILILVVWKSGSITFGM